MADYVPPDGLITFSFTVPYTPPDGLITFVFGEVAGDEVHIIYTPIAINCTLPQLVCDIVIEIVFHSVRTIIALDELVVEQYYEILYNGVTVAIIPFCIDVDGNHDHLQRITVIPEIALESLRVLVSSEAVEVSGGQYQDLPLKNCNTYSVPWQPQSLLHGTDYQIAWGGNKDVDQKVQVCTQQAPVTQTVNYGLWLGQKLKISVPAYGDWLLAPKLEQVNFGGYLNTLPKICQSLSGPYIGEMIKCTVPYTITYANPPLRTLTKTFDTSEFELVTLSSNITYLNAPKKEERHITVWGPRDLAALCRTLYYPPTIDETIVFKFQELYYSPEEIVFNFRDVYNFRCPWDTPTTGPIEGIRPITPITPFVRTEMPIQGMYYMENTTTMWRLSGLKESIDFKSVTASLDRSTFLWDFSIVILSEESMNLIKPVKDAYEDVVITINGWVFICRIDSWSEQEGFNQRSWTVSGSGTAMDLSFPQASPQLYTNSTDIHGGQYITDVLASFGWIADIASTDYINPFTQWLLPAGTINLPDKSPMQVVKALADTLGYFIAPAANTVVAEGGSKTLMFRPQYKTTPWLFSDTIVDHVITDEICLSLGRANRTSSPVDSVIVSGDVNGVIVNATRNGYPGTAPAEMVVDPYITTREAGLERAKHEICSRGYWVTHTLKLFSLYGPNTGITGLVYPGKLVKMQRVNNQTWFGVVDSTTISSGWTENGLQTTQTLTLEQAL